MCPVPHRIQITQADIDGANANHDKFSCPLTFALEREFPDWQFHTKFFRNAPAILHCRASGNNALLHSLPLSNEAKTHVRTHQDRGCNPGELNVDLPNEVFENPDAE